MRYLIHYLIILTAAFIFITGCSDTKDNLTQPGGVDVHGDGALNPSSDNFHAYYLQDASLTDCQSCHAADFSGGTAEVGCNGCHETIDVHTGDVWHANYIAENKVFFECASCHGEGFTGGISSPSCANCHLGIAVHKDGMLVPGNENFHGTFIRNDNWNLDHCKSCHGEDYAGGEVATTSCFTCHTSAAGPEACNTCHGNFYDIKQIAPPQGTANETETSSPAVGAHQSHLADITISEKTKCFDCHKVPTTFDAEGHIDDTERSELIFGAFANSGPTAAAYDFDNLTCQNTYCHGNFEFAKSSSSYPSLYASDKITGNNYSPIWNKVDGTQAQCGTCHGEINSQGELVTPLPAGHYGDFTLEDCVDCHTDVVDAAGNIISPSKHINGKANVFGN